MLCELDGKGEGNGGCGEREWDSGFLDFRFLVGFFTATYIAWTKEGKRDLLWEKIFAARYVCSYIFLPSKERTLRIEKKNNNNKSALPSSNSTKAPQVIGPRKTPQRHTLNRTQKASKTVAHQRNNYNPSFMTIGNTQIPAFPFGLVDKIANRKKTSEQVTKMERRMRTIIIHVRPTHEENPVSRLSIFWRIRESWGEGRIERADEKGIYETSCYQR